MIVFNWYSLFILLGVVQGIILLLSLSSKKEELSASGNLLKIIILIVTVTLAGRIVYLETHSLLLTKILTVGDLVIFLYGPLIYLFFQKYLDVQRTNLKHMWFHVSPALLHFVVMLPLLISTQDTFPTLNRVFYAKLYFFIELGAIIQLSVYYYLCWRILLQFQGNISNYLSFDYATRFLKSILLVMGLCISIWALSFLAFRFGIPFLPNYLGYHLTWIGLSFSVYVLSYYAMNHSEFFCRNVLKKESDNIPDDEELKVLKDKLLTLMHAEKPYLDPLLTLTRLSEASVIDLHTLSRIINTQIGKNFNDFVNSYRVSEFIELAKSESHKKYTLLSIAFESGFNSKSTFNSAFKKQTSQTPRDYISALN